MSHLPTQFKVEPPRGKAEFIEPLARLARLFRCSRSYHVEMVNPGRAKLDPDTKKIKVTYKAVTTPVTTAHWRRHVDGKCGLVLSPNLDDGTAAWAGFDNDDFGMDLGALARTIEERALPTIPCRSKSGGGHVLMFFAEPIPIAEAEAVARAIAGQLGLPDTEVFPRAQGPTVNPFCLNMPYLGLLTASPLHDQVGIKRSGLGMTLSECVRVAEQCRMDAAKRAEVMRGHVPRASTTVPPRGAEKRDLRTRDLFVPDNIAAMMRRDVGKGTIPSSANYHPDDDPVLKVECALDVIPADIPYNKPGPDQACWFKLVCAIADNFSEDDGFPLVWAWAKTSPSKHHHAKEPNLKTWDRAVTRKQRNGNVALSSIYYFADKYDPDKSWRKKYRDLLTRALESMS